MASILEVGAISVFVFLVMAELPPDISLLLLCGVFICQIAVDLWYVDSCIVKNIHQCVRKRDGCNIVRNRPGGLEASEGSETSSNPGSEKATVKVMTEPKTRKVTIVYNCFEMLLENKIVKSIALILQLASLVFFICRWCYVFMMSDGSLLYGTRILTAAPLCLIVLSLVWTNKFHEWIASVGRAEGKTARFKSSKHAAIDCLHVCVFVCPSVAIASMQ